MSFSAGSVANSILKLSEKEGIEVSPMKLQKLMFYCNVVHLVNKGDPLINEDFHAWRHGPVIPRVYQQFKGFGNRPIVGKRMTALEVAEDGEYESVPVESITDKYSAKLILAVWEALKDKSAVKLSNSTHKSGGPWESAYHSDSEIIDNGLVIDFYRKNKNGRKNQIGA